MSEINEDLEKGHRFLLARDYRAALKYLTRAAENGNVEAMYFVGNIYGNDTGFYEQGKSFFWHHKAAKLGVLQSMETIAYAYLSGRGAEASDALALEWFRRCSGELIYAKYSLFGLYAGMIGKKECLNPEFAYCLAKELYDKCKNNEQELHIGCMALGYCYLHGIGVEQNVQTAISIYEEAAKHTSIMNKIGDVYADILNDYETALKWFEKADKKSHPKDEYAGSRCRDMLAKIDHLKSLTSSGQGQNTMYSGN